MDISTLTPDQQLHLLRQAHGASPEDDDAEDYSEFLADAEVATAEDGAVALVSIGRGVIAGTVHDVWDGIPGDLCAIPDGYIDWHPYRRTPAPVGPESPTPEPSTPEPATSARIDEVRVVTQTPYERKRGIALATCHGHTIVAAVIHGPPALHTDWRDGSTSVVPGTSEWLAGVTHCALIQARRRYHESDAPFAGLAVVHQDGTIALALSDGHGGWEAAQWEGAREKNQVARISEWAPVGKIGEMADKALEMSRPAAAEIGKLAKQMDDRPSWTRYDREHIGPKSTWRD